MKTQVPEGVEDVVEVCTEFGDVRLICKSGILAIGKDMEAAVKDLKERREAAAKQQLFRKSLGMDW